MRIGNSNRRRKPHQRQMGITGQMPVVDFMASKQHWHRHRQKMYEVEMKHQTDKLGVEQHQRRQEMEKMEKSPQRWIASFWIHWEAGGSCSLLAW